MKLLLNLFFFFLLGFSQVNAASHANVSYQPKDISPSPKYIQSNLRPSSEAPSLGGILIKQTIERVFRKMGVLKPQSAGKLLIGLLLLLLGAGIMSAFATSDSSGAVLFGTILALVGAGMLGYDLLPFILSLDGNS